MRKETIAIVMGPVGNSGAELTLDLRRNGSRTHFFTGLELGSSLGSIWLLLITWLFSTSRRGDEYFWMETIDGEVSSEPVNVSRPLDSFPHIKAPLTILQWLQI